MKAKIEYVERQTFRQEPDVYDGPTCNKHRPRWITSYPKEGDEEDGMILKLEIDARSMPPGTLNRAGARLPQTTRTTL